MCVLCYGLMHVFTPWQWTHCSDQPFKRVSFILYPYCTQWRMTVVGYFQPITLISLKYQCLRKCLWVQNFSPISPSVKNALKVGVCVSANRSVHIKLASAQRFPVTKSLRSPNQPLLLLLLFFFSLHLKWMSCSFFISLLALLVWAHS